MKLRPHHLLCIQKFTGSGYDAAFTAHMTALVRTLRTQPDTSVTLTDGADDLCAACPHLHGGVCDSAAKTAALDAGVLSACGLCAGESAAWASLAQNSAKTVLQTPVYHQICACCEWYPLCRQTEAT